MTEKPITRQHGSPNQAYKAADNDWNLEPEQMFFLMQNHNAIEKAFAADDIEFLRAFEMLDEFKTLFADMNFDEAYDRYETILEACDQH